MAFGGGGSGGSGSIASSADVALSQPDDGHGMVYDSAVSKWSNIGVEVVLRWNDSTGTWPARPTLAPFGIIFLSTNDPAATAPAHANLRVGDVWRRHPDAS